MAPKKPIALISALALLIVPTLLADAAPVAYALHVSRSVTGIVQHDGVSVVNLATGTLIKTLPLACVDYFALAPDGTRLFVSCVLSRLVTALDTSTGRIVWSAYVDALPGTMVITPDGSRLFVLCSMGLITVLDTSSGGVVESVPLEGTPLSAVLTPDGSRLLVRGVRYASVIDTTALRNIGELQGNVWGHWSVPSDGSVAYIAVGDVVCAVNPVDGTCVRTFSVPGRYGGQGVQDFSVSPDGRTGWGLQRLGMYTTDLVAFDIGAGTVTYLLSVYTMTGYSSWFMGFDPTGSRLWLKESPNAVEVVDTNSRSASRVELGMNSQDIAFSSDGELAYATNVDGRFVSVLDARTAGWTGMNIAVDVIGKLVLSEMNSLSTLVDGEGSVQSVDGALDCGTTCSSLYPLGATAALTAVPKDGWVFAGWQGDADCVDGSVAMTADRACTAVFRLAGAAAPARALEFNGDGVADLFLYNSTTGSWAMALGNGAGTFAFAGDRWSPEWKVVAERLNGDDLADLFVYNKSTGFWYQALNAGGGRFAYTGGRFSPGWHVLAGRFRPGLLDDILVYNPAGGGAFLCFVDGGGQFSNYAFFDWSPGWDLRVIDLNGDGISDTFAYNPVSGRWYSCLSTGAGAFSYVGGSWSPGWTLTVGDFDGNGRDDVFVYNVDNGFWYTCLSVGDGAFTYRGGSWSPGQVVFRARLTTVPRDDIFTYDPASGSWAQWFGDGTGRFSGSLRGTWSTGWTISVADLSGDGVDDVFTYNPTTGALFDCITNPTGGFAACVPGHAEPGFIAVAR